MNITVPVISGFDQAYHARKTYSGFRIMHDIHANFSRIDFIIQRQKTKLLLLLLVSKQK
jgi:hypothetical protein